MENFSEIELPLPIQKALAKLNYVKPTPIQVKAIPVAMSRRDLVGCAETGTGKTAAFLIPLVVALLKDSQKKALVLAPTRELALQIDEALKEIAHFCPTIKSALLIGGMPITTQKKNLAKNPCVFIATPGRLVDHLRRGWISLRSTEFLVLDEADRMLDMGFAAQLAEILRFIPSVRQTLMFTATMPPNIERLASKYLKSPVRVSDGADSKPASKITQEFMQITASHKNKALQDQLQLRTGSVLIFARTKQRTDAVARVLTAAGHSVDRLHGNRTQGQRIRALEGFRKGTFRILVATDVAARGIDVPHVAHVINYDLPMVAEDYIHRVGRTARAGATGQSMSFVTPEERHRWRDISRMISDDHKPATIRN